MRKMLTNSRLLWIGFLTAFVVATFSPWTLRTTAQIAPFAYIVPPTQCSSTVSANSTGTNGQTTAGTSSTPVVQADTSSTAALHQYICNLAPPSPLTTTGTNLRVVDVVFLYNITANNLGQQANVLASGTFNGATVFSSITHPSPGPTEAALDRGARAERIRARC